MENIRLRKEENMLTNLGNIYEVTDASYSRQGGWLKRWKVISMEQNGRENMLNHLWQSWKERLAIGVRSCGSNALSSQDAWSMVKTFRHLKPEYATPPGGLLRGGYLRHLNTSEHLFRQLLIFGRFDLPASLIFCLAWRCPQFAMASKDRGALIAVARSSGGTTSTNMNPNGRVTTLDMSSQSLQGTLSCSLCRVPDVRLETG